MNSDVSTLVAAFALSLTLRAEPALPSPVNTNRPSAQALLDRHAESHRHLEAGPLTLDIDFSETAHLFHVVDQIPQWSEFCHRPYARLHVAEEYHAMLTQNARPGDTIILLLSLDDDQARVPAAFADLLPVPWEEVENPLKQGRVVFQRGQARGMAVFLLAAPTTEALRKELRRFAAEKKFSP